MTAKRLLACALALILLGSAVPGAARAQTVLARVVDGETSGPVFGALAYLVDGGGATVRSALTDELGRVLFVGLEPGTYRVRVEMIGKTTASSAPLAVSAGGTTQSEIRMAASAIVLEGIEVEADERCRVRPEDGLVIADVWDEARKALAAAAFTEQQDVYRYKITRYDRELDRDSRAVLQEETSNREGFMRVPFESLPAEALIADGFVQDDGGRQRVYYAPDAEVLLSDPFLDSHCFRLEEGNDESEGLIGLGFEPADGRSRRVVDIAGTLWMDPATAELEWLEFRYLNLDPDITTDYVGGHVEFRRMPGGTWIVPEWWIRMPKVAMTRGVTGQSRLLVTGYRQSGGRVLDVREAGGGSIVRAESATIEGFVHDSLGLTPVKGVRVGVVGANQQVFTDAEGRFRIMGLSEGVYRIQFVDPRLEQFGFIPEPVTREAHEGEVTSIIYRVPPLSDLLFEACREELPGEQTAVLAGEVHDATTGRPLAGASVRVRWNSYRMTPRGSPNRQITGADVYGLEVKADERGFYRMCGVPEAELLYVSAFYQEVESEPDTLTIPEFSGGILRVLDWRR